MGVYVNADIIESRLRSERICDFAEYGITVVEDDFTTKYLESGLYALSKVKSEHFRIENNRLKIDAGIEPDSYFAAFVAEYLRYAMLGRVEKITIETVMSSPAKLDYLKTAASHGYRIYIYYISTRSADINVARVKARVQQGGHDVAEDKIRSRYVRSLNNLLPVVLASDRAYFFDNSGDKYSYIAEYDGKDSALSIYLDEIPQWFASALLEKDMIEE